ncbi:IMPACT family protein [Zhouia sp. PK063]|uniref:IMPACT family protein n=1 Tax=Zhouia sp. PK063 TaxID=3373602 RepID=UPI0037A6F87E
MTEQDVYKTIEQPTSEVLFKDKNSKFFGYAFPVLNEDEIKFHIEEIKKQHHSARHWCYAWQLGAEQLQYRANDDGEPNNSAGMPIYGQIQSFEVTNILIMVVRYFGGVKLGVGGLINAYKTTAQMALENASITKKTINIQYKLTFEYENMNKVMRIIKEKNLDIIHQDLSLNCKITFCIRKSEANQVHEIFDHLYKVDIKKLDN